MIVGYPDRSVLLASADGTEKLMATQIGGSARVLADFVCHSA
jgi:hypothetical protein